MKTIFTSLSAPAPLAPQWGKALWDSWQRYRMQRAERAAMSPRVLKCRADFERAAGVDAATFLMLATAGLPDLEGKSLIYDDKDSTYFSVKIHGKKYSDFYIIDFDEGGIGPGAMSNDRGDRITGRRMFAQRLIMSKYLGFDTLTLTASLGMGAYVWAQAGARMDDGDKPDISKHMMNRLEAIRDRLAVDTYANAEYLIRLEHDSSLQKIAKLSTVLKDIDAVWNTQRIAEEQYPIPFKDYRKRGVVNGRDMTLGQYLVLGLHYGASIDLNNPEQMARVETYTGVPIRATAASYSARYPRNIAVPA